LPPSSNARTGSIATNKGLPVTCERTRYRLMGAIRWCDEVVEASPYFPDAGTLVEHDCDYALHGGELPRGHRSHSAPQ